MAVLDRRYAKGLADRATRDVMAALGGADSLLDADEHRHPDAIPDRIRQIFLKVLMGGGHGRRGGGKRRAAVQPCPYGEIPSCGS